MTEVAPVVRRLLGRETPVDVLLALREAPPEGLTVPEVADCTGHDPSTVYQYLNDGGDLDACGFVESVDDGDGGGRRWRLADPCGSTFEDLLAEMAETLTGEADSRAAIDEFQA